MVVSDPGSDECVKHETQGRRHYYIYIYIYLGGVLVV